MEKTHREVHKRCKGGGGYIGGMKGSQGVHKGAHRVQRQTQLG